MKTTYLNLRILLFLILALIVNALNAQKLFNNNFVHYNVAQSDLNLVPLNYHLPVNIQNKQVISDADKNLNDMSIFAVFQNNLDINEILEVENKNFKLNSDKVIGFEEVALSNGTFPKVISYKESVKYNLNNQKNQLKIVQDNALYEAIVFPFSVNTLQRKKIETYLGIKYSVSLKHDYIDTKGDVIFNLKENEDYAQNIFGLGRDDESGLYQKQSMDNSGILQLSLGAIQQLNKDNTSEIENHNFLFISDNGEDISFDNEADEDLAYSSKTWKGQFVGDNLRNRNFELYLDLNKLSDSVTKNTQYWLVLSQNDKNLDLKTATYIPFTETNSENSLLGIKDLNLKDLDKSFLFTIAKTKDFTFTYDLQKMNCETVGELSVRVKGNDDDSYTITLTNQNDKKSETINGKSATFSNLPEGEYQLTVSSDKGKSLYESLTIESLGITEAENITVASNGRKTLDANDYLTQDITEFWWEYNGNLISRDYILNIGESGEYSLVMNSSLGCTGYRNFAVNIADTISDNTYNDGIALAPNPVKANQEFNVYLNFENSSDIILSIYTLDGSIIETEKIYQRKNAVVQKKLSQTGVYLIIVETPTNILRQKLIVN